MFDANEAINDIIEELEITEANKDFIGNMNNNISFTGINNIYTGKKIYSQIKLLIRKLTKLKMLGQLKFKN